MHLRSDSFAPYDRLDARLAFGRYDPATHVALAGNRNPHLQWSDPPPGTKSFALLMWDADVPSRGDDVNQEGRTVPVDLPRVDFFHWVLADVPAYLRSIGEGKHSDGITVRGKAPGPAASGGVQGLNDYTGWFAGNAEMSGDYAGYDGPGPPWNDERVHGYHVGVYALGVATLGLQGRFTGADVRTAMAGHVLGHGELVGVYWIRPR